MTTLGIATADDDWEDIAEGDCPDDPGARILLRGGLTINGVSFHLEGWAVGVNEEDGVQRAVYDDENLGYIHLGVGADGRWETVELRGREYILIASPFCW